MLENRIETALKKGCKKLGALCLKWVSPGNRGVMDRIVIYRGRVWWRELKRPGKKLEPLQVIMHRDMAAQGMDVGKLDSLEDVKKFLDEISTA
jgi:hypothetical protein